MLRMNQVMKTAVSLVLSAMMALPTISLARSGNGDDEPAGTMDGAPVIVEQVMDREGHTAMLAIVPVTPAEESAVVDKLIRHNPSGIHLGVASSEDPLLRTAIKSGFFSKIKTYFVGQGEDSALVQMQERPSARQRLSDKMKQLTERARESKMGLIASVAYSGILGSSVWVTSSSVPAGASIFSMVALWNAFVLIAPEMWHKAMSGGANLGSKLAGGIANFFGVPVSDIALRAGEVVGRIAVTFLVSAAQVALTRAFEGEMSMWTNGVVNGIGEDLSNITFKAALYSYFLWDAVVLEKYQQAKLSFKGVERYLVAQYIVGGALEYAHNQHYAGSAGILFGLTGAAILYQLLNIEQKQQVSSAPLKLKFALRNGALQVAEAGAERKALIQRKIDSYRSRMAKTKERAINGCEILLLQTTQIKKRSASPGGFPLWDDIQ